MIRFSIALGCTSSGPSLGYLWCSYSSLSTRNSGSQIYTLNLRDTGKSSLHFFLQIPHKTQYVKLYKGRKQTVKRAADNKYRLSIKHRKSARYSACFVVRGFQRGLPLGTRLCLQSVVYYMLCRCCGSVNRSLIVPYQSQITKSCTFPCNNNYNYSEMKNINKKSVSPIKTHRWSECRDSNPGPLGPEPSAIPSFATPRL